LGRDAIEHHLYLMDQAFDADRFGHPLLTNLASVRDDDWFWLPDGGDRSIFDIVQHIGECKYVYDNHAFGDRSMRWDVPGSTPTVKRETPPADIIAWVREGHRRLRASVAALTDDAELLRPRKASWGKDHETRWLINEMIQHDLYHGGEINHLRALHQHKDRWAHEEEET
jgi:hypothetical protein